MIRAALLLMLLMPAGLAAQQPDSADTAWRRGDIDTAYRLYQELLAQDSSDVLALHRVGLVKAWNGDYPQSLHLLERALAIEPQNAAVAVDHARVLGWSRRFDDALAELDRVLTAVPADTGAIELKALILGWSGRSAEALRMWDLLATKIGDPERIAVARARALIDIGRGGEALAIIRRHIAADAASEETRKLITELLPLMVYAGQQLSWTQQFDSAQAVFEQVLQLAPDNVDARLAQAANYRYQGRNRDARRVLDLVAQLQPDHPRLAEERNYLRRATAPAIAPSFSYISDSEGNRIATLGVDGTVPITDVFEIRLGGSRKDFTMETRPALDQSVVAAQAGVGMRSSNGWRGNALVGIWQPERESDRRIMTAAAAISSPYSKRLQAGVSFQQSLYDVTALVVENDVRVREVRADATVGAGGRTSLVASAAAARFDGTDENTRLLGSLRLSHRPFSWLTTGPAARFFRFSRDLDEGYWDPDSYVLIELPLVLTRTRGKIIPFLEIAPGYQRIEQAAVQDPWSASVRLQGGLTYVVRDRRQISVTGVYANSGLAQLSPVGDAGYKYRAVTVYAGWAF